MASSGDVVEAVLGERVEVEQPAEACDGESRWPATATMEESQPMLQEQEQQRHDDTAPVADHHEAVAAPEQVPAEASASKEPEQQHDYTAPIADHHEAVAAPEQVPSSASEEPEQQKPVVGKEEVEPEAAAADEQESTRERLKRHRREMAGRVWVPEMWGQEKLLKDWVDCAVFDRPLVPAGLLTARRALIAEGYTRRPDRTSSPTSSAGSSPLRVRNGCS